MSEFFQKENLFVLRTGDSQIIDEFWDQWCGALQSQSIKGPIRVLVDARGSTHRPNAVQREKLRLSVPPKLVKSAVISENILVRGMVTVLGWYNYEDIKGYDGHSFKQALDYLGCSKEECSWVLSVCAPVP